MFVCGVKNNPYLSFSSFIAYFTVNGLALLAKVISFTAIGSSVSLPKSSSLLEGVVSAARAVAFLML